MTTETLLIIIALIFAAGTILLSRSSIKRHAGIIFMIRTGHGLKLMDTIANLSPRIWRFVADFSIALSFGGLGVYYVSGSRRVEKILLIFGAVAVSIYGFFYFVNGTHLLFLLASAAACAYLVISMFRESAGNRKIYGVIGFIFVSLITFAVMNTFIRDNPINDILNPLTAIMTGIAGLPAFLLCLMLNQAVQILMEMTKMPGISPLLPGVASSGEIGFFFPGTGIFVPFWYLFIALIVTIVVHEVSHGILARVSKIPLKSVGLITVGILPIGAFVEPDEDEMKKRPGIEKMRVFAMGSFANLTTSIIAIIAIIALGIFMSSVTAPAGMLIVGIMEDYPAFGKIEAGSVISGVDGERVNSYADFFRIIENTTAGQKLVLNVTECRSQENLKKSYKNNNSDEDAVKNNDEILSIYYRASYFGVECEPQNYKTVTLAAAGHPDNSSRAYLGISIAPDTVYSIKSDFLTNNHYLIGILSFIGFSLFWIFFINFNIALVNLLPVLPLDGGHMFGELVNSMSTDKKIMELIISLAIMATLFLMLINASPLLDVFLRWIGL